MKINIIIINHEYVSYTNASPRQKAFIYPPELLVFFKFIYIAHFTQWQFKVLYMEEIKIIKRNQNN